MALVIPAQVAATFSSRKNRCRDGSGMRAVPECIVLGVASGVKPSSKPPVRIFLGTEPAQQRAERVFVWSIERLRDPSRVYEIHLMKELAGFNRRRWLTGFTNYRFAIPHFAKGVGRAIWNDVDQAYLTDPAELFDQDMGGHGFLMTPSLSSSTIPDSSVMLMDCARMARIWSIGEAQRGRKNRLLQKALSVPDLAGELAPQWNARDEQYVPGCSKLLHWTALHTQPWRPLPGLFVYQDNPVGELWFELERCADAAGFETFQAGRPTRQYRELAARCQLIGEAASGASRARNPVERQASRRVCALVQKTGARTMLEVELSMGAQDPAPRAKTSEPAGQPRPSRQATTIFALAALPLELHDGVLCGTALEVLPDEDVPWVLNELFRRARRFLHVEIGRGSRFVILPDGSHRKKRPRTEKWWEALLARVGKRYPAVHWSLEMNARAAFRHKRGHIRNGGPCLRKQPLVWLLSGAREAAEKEGVALARALGWPYVVCAAGHRENQGGPWPDLAICPGQRTVATGRWIASQSRGSTKLVHVGVRRGDNTEGFDLTITPRYYCLPPRPERLETTAPLTPVSPKNLARAAQRWPALFGSAPRPRILLLVGGTTSCHKLDARGARRLGENVRTLAERVRGSIFAVTHRQTGPKATGALVLGLGPTSHLCWWHPGQEDPHLRLAYMASADVIVVTGECGPLLAEAASSGKPVHIYPLPERRPGPRRHLRALVQARAQSRPLNRRGTVRPQQGLEYLCARLLERGTMHPHPDINILHQELIRLGIARFFGEPLQPESKSPHLSDTEHAAQAVRSLLGILDVGRVDKKPGSRLVGELATPAPVLRTSQAPHDQEANGYDHT